MNSDISFPSHREYRFYQGLFASFIANGIQAVNFLSDRFLRKAHRLSLGIDELYRHAVDSAFSPQEAFPVTGAPHATAYYPRDFAWFYPDVLDPETIMDSDDAIRRVRLLEKSVRLMLEAVRSNVVTTTIIPAGHDRYIGINYFSLPSDTLLGILAGLEQIIRADQRTSPYLAMSQGAHAGRLLLAEYREDLKKAIFQLAEALEPFEEGERALFATTTDLILAEPRFGVPGTSHFLVSADNPLNKMIHKIAAPAYQGRSSWPTFNVEFADRMLEYDEHSGTHKYRSCAQ